MGNYSSCMCPLRFLGGQENEISSLARPVTTALPGASTLIPPVSRVARKVKA
jgi:hypothetical protein